MQFSKRVDRLSPSPIREILKVIDQPGMISFAGGLPSTESFPEIDQTAIPREILQYGATEGEASLRERVAEELCERGLAVDAEQILILSGSQQGIDLVAKLLIDTGTRVAVEAPTYLAALQVFSLFGADTVTYHAADHSGLQSQKPPQLIYTIPTFQNPTGYCYSLEERRALAARANTLDCVLFEDDPYRDLVYGDCERTPVCAFAENTSWVYQSSFSKTFAPGLRLGYLACSRDLFARLAWLKQAADLHSNRLSQALVLSMLATASDRLPDVVASYRARRDTFHECLRKTLSPYASWSIPAGGLFFWLTLKPQIQLSPESLLQQSLKQNVAFMPGAPFFTRPDPPPSLRLNFSHSSPEQMQRGLEILAGLIAA